MVQEIAQTRDRISGSSKEISLLRLSKQNFLGIGLYELKKISQRTPGLRCAPRGRLRCACAGKHLSCAQRRCPIRMSILFVSGPALESVPTRKGRIPNHSRNGRPLAQTLRRKKSISEHRRMKKGAGADESRLLWASRRFQIPEPQHGKPRKEGVSGKGQSVLKG